MPANAEDPAASSDLDQRDAAGPVQLVSADVEIDPTPAVPRPELVQLTLRQAIELGLDQNPDLNALRQNESVGAAAFGVAATYPFNPFVQVQATPLQNQANGGSGTVYHYVLLMQQIQLAHQQQFREEGGAAALNTIRWNIRQAELLNVAQTERLFLTALYLRDVHQLTRTNAESNAQLLKILERQLAAGQAAAADVAIVRLDARATRRQADLAEANYNTALLDLRRQLNLPAGTRIELIGGLMQWRWEPATPDRLADCQALTATQSGPWVEQSLIEVL
ncbi:MAG TPA: TolC family protein, partial [Planctomycetaceae bacterium]|nr:TolC family protein [Planctomycetaceae bacterium]